MTSEDRNDGALRVVLIVVAVVVLAPMLMMLLAFPMMGMWGGMMGGFGGTTGPSPAVALVSMLAWALVILGGGYMVYRAFGGDEELGGDPALEELRMAYARGDLTDEEFETRRANLRRG